MKDFILKANVCLRAVLEDDTRVYKKTAMGMASENPTKADNDKSYLCENATFIISYVTNLDVLITHTHSTTHMTVGPIVAWNIVNEGM